MINDLIKFLIKAKRDGYASGDTTIVKNEDGSSSTNFSNGDFKFNDSWFGTTPFGGREIVWRKNKPYWIMVYYGEEFIEGEKAIPTLRKALSKMPEDFPARGPRKLMNGEYRYENNWKGSLGNFSGEENIFLKGEKVFSCWYKGGLVK